MGFVVERDVNRLDHLTSVSIIFVILFVRATLWLSLSQTVSSGFSTIIIKSIYVRSRTLYFVSIQTNTLAVS